MPCREIRCHGHAVNAPRRESLRSRRLPAVYPNPAQNAEQLSFLIYFYMYEAADAARVARGAAAGRRIPYASAFAGDWTLRDPRNAREPRR